MYNERLEQLIDAALADGELTEKEKQILFKNAQALGVDLDEFEMVLDARLVKLKRTEAENAKTSAPKSNKLGDVKKCPNCGAMVQSYQGICSECGYAFEGIDANAAAKELANLLINASQSNYKKIIETYPIPMDKASLIQFTTWLSPHTSDTIRKADYDIINAYVNKYAECIRKLKISFPNDKEAKLLMEQFEIDKQQWRKNQRRYKRNQFFFHSNGGKAFWILLGIIAWFALIALIGILTE
ncbi:MAG: hypothetical protein HUK18_05680 [Bacteroidales bacterium]|nr:hypothetical protein [Bacteroidales bacterium]